MPRNARWIINPVVTVDGMRMPKVVTIEDPGTPLRDYVDDFGVPFQKRNVYDHSSAIGESEWALSFVRGVDFSAIDTDPECIILTGDDQNLSLNQDMLPIERRLQLKTEMTNRGIDFSDLPENAPIWRWLERVGKKVMPEFQPKGTWVGL